jgi:hypothetical protein
MLADADARPACPCPAAEYVRDAVFAGFDMTNEPSTPAAFASADPDRSR